MELTYLVKEQEKIVCASATFEEAKKVAEQLIDKEKSQRYSEVLVLELMHGAAPLNDVYAFDCEQKRWLDQDLNEFKEERVWILNKATE
ncbi:hypothetical protein ACSH5D_002342 [Listeria monocytogenes]|nr:hypothetical protein [Listeria monocytogenes]EAF2263479.1 hypothetical protein [Listeria monocytogenes]EGC1201766.1 hypothetical protein [Listeria monocytogenes]